MVSLYYVSAVDTINDGQSKSILYSKYYILVFSVLTSDNIKT